MIDQIHRIFDFDDIPRSGIASYNNKPHVFKCIFDESIDDYTDKFRLQELDIEILDLLEEQDSLRTRWDNKITKTKEDKASYPVLPEDEDRFHSISQKIDIQLEINESTSFIKIGNFFEEEYMKFYDVEWNDLK